MICRVKSIALAVALCVAGVMVAQGRDLGLVSIPDALNPQPRPEDVYECTISGKTWFGCTYERRGDGDLVIYEGGRRGGGRVLRRLVRASAAPAA